MGSADGRALRRRAAARNLESLDAHGFYWTRAVDDPGDPWFYNFGGQRFLNRHSDGDAQTALSVRCVRDVAPAAEVNR